MFKNFFKIGPKPEGMRSWDLRSYRFTFRYFQKDVHSNSYSIPQKLYLSVLLPMFLRQKDMDQSVLPELEE